MSAPKNGGPAHPIFVVAGAAHLGEHQLEQLRKAVEDRAPGVSVRDYFAAQALTALAPVWADHGTPAEVATDCYKLADAMLAERAK